jgi:hypothetical protein
VPAPVRTPVTAPPSCSIASTSTPSSTSLAAAASARTVARGSALPSCGARIPPAIRGERPGSSARQRDGVSHSARARASAAVVQAAERLGVVAVGRDDERAAVAVAGREAGDLLELRGERGPALARQHVHAERALLAEVHLGHGREHPGATSDVPRRPMPLDRRRAADMPRLRARHAHERRSGPRR